MSEQNIELVRQWHAGTSAGREACLATIADLCDPDVDFYPVRKFPEARPCHGKEEFSRFFAEFLEGFPEATFGLDDVIAVGDDRVLASGYLRAVGRGSGIVLEGDLYSCHWVRHGRFFRIENHLTLRGALRALGLEGDTLEAVGLK